LTAPDAAEIVPTVDQELIEYLERKFSEFRADLRQELRRDLAASAAETRRHLDVVAELLMGKLQLVTEGVIDVDQKVDRLAIEMRTGFQNVDRRFLHLEARVIAPRD
jgi:hypothetical protein